MEKEVLNLSIRINAPKEKVWDVLLQDRTYRLWTSVFHPGSYVETDWQQGSKALFKTPEGDGLVSRIILNKPYEVISMEHLGVLKGGVEDMNNEEAKKWQGFRETYKLFEQNGSTLLEIEQDMVKEYSGYFTDTWKKALEKVKELSEE